PANRAAVGHADDLGFASNQPGLGMDVGGRCRTRGRYVRAGLSHQHGHALFPDRHNFRVSSVAGHPRPRDRSDDEAGAPPFVPLPPYALMAQPKLAIRGPGKTSRTDRGEVVPLAGVDLEVGENEFVALVGTSGCGKSTLLSIVAGLESMDQGVVTIDDEPVTPP